MKKKIAWILLVPLVGLLGCQLPSDIEPNYGKTNPTPEQFQEKKIKRYGSVIGLRPEKEQYYRERHANTWPGVIDRLEKSNIRTFSIYVTELDGKKYLFSYYEYSGDDFEADMQKIADDPTTQKWWEETAPCQFKLPNRKKPEDNWSAMEMVFLME